MRISTIYRFTWLCWLMAGLIAYQLHLHDAVAVIAVTPVVAVANQFIYAHLTKKEKYD